MLRKKEHRLTFAGKEHFLKKGDSSRSTLPSKPHQIGNDSRPLRDKEYQRQMIQDIQAFLFQNGYPYQIDKSDFLHKASSKHYFECVEFLIQFVDPDFKFNKTVEKPEILVQDYAIYFKYPPGLKNRDFTPVGAFNTWGNLLGFAHWLMNMAIYTNYYQDEGKGKPENLLDQPIDSIDILNLDITQLQEHYIKKINTLPNVSDSKQQKAAIEAKYLDILKRRRNKKIAICIDHERKSEEIQKKIDEKERIKQINKERQDKNKKMRMEIEKKKKRTKESENYIAGLKDNIETIELTFNECTVENENTKTTVKELEDKIKKQSMTFEEFENKQSQINQKSKEIDDLRKDIEKISEENKGFKESSEALESEFKKVVNTHNDSIKWLNEMPETRNKDYRFSLDLFKSKDFLNSKMARNTIENNIFNIQSRAQDEIESLSKKIEQKQNHNYQDASRIKKLETEIEGNEIKKQKQEEEKKELQSKYFKEFDNLTVKKRLEEDKIKELKKGIESNQKPLFEEREEIGNMKRLKNEDMIDHLHNMEEGKKILLNMFTETTDFKQQLGSMCTKLSSSISSSIHQFHSLPQDNNPPFQIQPQPQPQNHHHKNKNQIKDK